MRVENYTNNSFNISIWFNNYSFWALANPIYITHAKFNNKIEIIWNPAKSWSSMNVPIERKLNLRRRKNNVYALYNLFSIFVLSYSSPMKNFIFRLPFSSNYYFDLKIIKTDKLVSTTKIINKTKNVSSTPKVSPL